MQKLCVKIDGRLEPEDFIEILESVESLYYKAITDRRGYYPYESFYFGRRFSDRSYTDGLTFMNDWLLKEARMRTYGENRIVISRIQYASPGGIDFAGIGQAIEAIDRTIGRLIEFFTERNKRREGDKQARIDTQIREIELEKARESLRSIQIKNAKEILKSRREFPEEIQEILLPLAVRDQERLSRQIAEGKLIGIERKSDDEEQ